VDPFSFPFPLPISYFLFIPLFLGVPSVPIFSRETQALSAARGFLGALKRVPDAIQVSIVTLDWSAIMGGYKSPDTVVSDKRTKYVTVMK